MMNYEKDWREKLEVEVRRFGRMIRDLAHSVLLVAGIVVYGYVGTQIYEEHKTLMRMERRHTETHSRRKQLGYFLTTTKAKSKRKPPPTSPLEPILIPMGPPPSP